MKHKGNYVDFTAQRNSELMRAFKKAYSEFPSNDIHKVFEIAVSYPCSRFWVSEERAMLVISSLMKGQPILDTMLPTKREMFIEILKRYQVARKRQPNKPFFDIVFDIVNSPAPKFYMTPGSAMVTYYKIKQGHYNNQKRIHH